MSATYSQMVQQNKKLCICVYQLLYIAKYRQWMNLGEGYMDAHQTFLAKFL